MNRTTLLDAIRNSGGTEQPDTEIDGLLAKLQLLEDTGKYARLLASIASANDKSNFLSAILEVTFAFQFERSGFPLYYEVQQDDGSNSSIDFLQRTASDISIYFEARFLQQDNATGESIREQLHGTGFYRVAMNGEAEHDAIVRLQSVILSKVQNSDGNPIKFLRTSNGIVNIVVIDVSDMLLGPLTCTTVCFQHMEIHMLTRYSGAEFLACFRSHYPVTQNALTLSPVPMNTFAVF